MARRLAFLVLRWIGWQPVFTPPPGSRSVIIVYPHTSNWDFPLGILFRCCCGIPFNWAGKDSLFCGPAKWLFLKLGGVPINRREPNGTTARLAEAFAQRDSFHLCIAPEGTRSRVGHWKTGFYHLARSVNVPVGLGFIDYGRKRLGIERWIMLTGDRNADLSIIREYYAGIAGLYPEKAGQIRFERS